METALNARTALVALRKIVCRSPCSSQCDVTLCKRSRFSFHDHSSVIAEESSTYKLLVAKA